MPKSTLKGNPNLKASADDYEYYDKNTRDYSKYAYENQEEVILQKNKPSITATNSSQSTSIAKQNATPIQNFQKQNAPVQTFQSNKIASNPLPQNQAYNKDKYYQESTNQDDEEENEGNSQNEEEDDEDENNENNENGEDDDNNGNPDEFGEPGEMIKCTMGCGRKFNANAIKKHIKICKKVFQSKRKVFDSSKARVDGIVVDKVKGKTNNNKSSAANNKKNLWKKQSEAFRAMLKQTKGAPLTQQEQNTFEEAQGLVLCNFCGRKFKDETAKKHIPFCENKTKMDKMKQQNSKRK